MKLSSLSPRLCLIALLVAGHACGGEAPDPLGRGLSSEPSSNQSEDDADLSGPRCAVELTALAVYQSVKIPLATSTVVERRNAEVIAGKPALFRIFARPTAGATEARVRLVLTTPSAITEYETSATFAAPSQDEAPDSTLDVQVPGSDVQADTQVHVELLTPACAALARTRLPRSDAVPLRPVNTGTLRVRLVPVRYDADGSGRLPDTSPAQLAAFHDALLAMYPVSAVELTVREPVPSRVALQAPGGWTETLDLIRQTRARNRTPAEVYDFGLVAPAPSHAAFCGTGCTTGVSYVPDAESAGKRASVGLGFSGPLAVEVLAHELGHAHGRAHAPCGQVRDADPAFPYPQALIGVWGYDQRADALLAPSLTRDIMGYCGPRWVSDYTYRALTARSLQVNRKDNAAVAASTP